MNDSMMYYTSSWDETARRLTIKGAQNNTTETVAMLTYTQTDSNELRLEGVLHNESVTIHLKERDLQTYRLMNNQFRWIQEYPFNR